MTASISDQRPWPIGLKNRSDGTGRVESNESPLSKGRVSPHSCKERVAHIPMRCARNENDGASNGINYNARNQNL
jgi:hypothetical protein